MNNPDRNQRAQKRARRKIAAVRLAHPNDMANVHAGPKGNFSLKQRQAIRDAYAKLRGGSSKPSKPKAPPTNPTNPTDALTPKAFNNEVKAETNLQFAPQIQQAKQAITDQDKHAALVASAYDQYHEALQQALANTNAANAAAATDAKARLDSAYNQDQAAAQTVEGKQAAAGARGLSNQALTTLNTESAAATGTGNERVANSLLAKTEALGRESDSRKKLESDLATLKAQKGNFSVAQRQKLRQDERTWLATQKEFGLNQAKFKEQRRVDTANIKATKGQYSAQKLIAKLYADADKAKARATIRVAKLQLEKGKIDQHQYRKIINVYRGLPKHGQAPQAKGTGGSRGQGSGPGGAWSPAEQKQIDRAAQSLTDKLDKRQIALSDRQRAVDTMVRNGMSRAQANAAWRAFVHRNRLNNGQNIPTNKR